MATGRRPDPRRRKTAHVHASYLKVPNGASESAWKAGEMFGCYGHRTHAMQPCYADLTNDQHECPYCKSGLIPEWRGYVPLWDRDWALRYVLIGEDYFATVDAIPHRAQVTVSRAKNPISPLVLREEMKLLRQLPERSPWSETVDMLAICLTLWKSELLYRWFEANPLPKVTARVTTMKINGKEVAKQIAPTPERYKAPAQADDDAEPIGTILNRAKERLALSNGKKK